MNLHVRPLRAIFALSAFLFPIAAALAQHAASPLPSSSRSACTPDVCTITVRINGHCRSPDGITVQPPVVATQQPKIILRWLLGDGAYEFSEDGIVFDDIAQFEQLPSPNYIREQRILDTRMKAGDFRYIVRVRGCPVVTGIIRHE